MSRTRSRSKAAPRRRPGSGSLGRRVAFGLVAGIVSAIALAGGTVSAWAHFARGGERGARLVELAPSAGYLDVSRQLEGMGLVGSSRLMALYLATLGRFGDVESGPHWLPGGATPRTLAQCLARDARRPEAEVTIPEGFDHLRVAQRLEQAGVCTAAAFVSAVRSRELLDSLGIRARDGEGYLFPATYRFHLDAVPERVFRRLVTETRSRLKRLAVTAGEEPFTELASRRGWGEAEILTLASIVEKEARLPDERPVVASVFLNRLDSESFRPKRMLQSDPTAAYGCLVLGESIPSCRGFQQRITPAMLRDASNPYNTYRHAGLPPGPIANPGEASILAVLKPAKTEYLFFVATGDGRHRFATTFEDHDAAIHRAGSQEPRKEEWMERASTGEQ